MSGINETTVDSKEQSSSLYENVEVENIVKNTENIGKNENETENKIVEIDLTSNSPVFYEDVFDTENVVNNTEHNNEKVEEITNTLLELIEYWEHNTVNFVLIIAKIMEMVEDYKDVSSLDKKVICVLSATKIFKHISKDKDEENILVSLIPNTIEIIVNLTKDRKQRKNNIKIDLDDLEEILVKKLIKEDTKNSENILIIILTLLNIIEEYQNIESEKRKEILVRTIRKYYEKMDKSDMNNNEKSLLNFVMMNLEKIIDYMILSKQGKYIINKIKKFSFKKFFNKISCIKC